MSNLTDAKVKRFQKIQDKAWWLSNTPLMFDSVIDNIVSFTAEVVTRKYTYVVEVNYDAAFTPTNTESLMVFSDGVHFRNIDLTASSLDSVYIYRTPNDGTQNSRPLFIYSAFEG